MINTSHNTLKNLAALVWILGGTILFLKGYLMLKLAIGISDNILTIIAILIIALIVGLFKNRFIMSKFCKKNLSRIYNLVNPKFHQFFELKFFIFLTLMIFTGAFLSKIAIENYFALLAVGTLDLALSTALLTSSVHFFKKD